jgi:hypothetical protein
MKESGPRAYVFNVLKRSENSISSKRRMRSYQATVEIFKSIKDPKRKKKGKLV